MRNLRISLKKIIFVLLILLYSVELAHAGDENQIIELCKNGGSVHLEGKTYLIQNSFELPNGIELIGTDGTVLQFAPECGIPQNVPMISLTGKTNITIRNIRFEGDQDHQTYALKYSNPNHPEQSGKKAYGNQVGTFIYAVNTRNILVTGCSFNNNLGDGLRLSGCKNVEFSYNTGQMGGHDTFFGLRTEGIAVHHNNIKTLVNSAVRLLDCSHVRVYNNIVSWEGPRDAGPAIQIQHDTNQMTDIEVCGNKIYSSCGPGLWLVGKTSGGEELWLHHNMFMNCGDNRITWVGGIIASGYDGAKIENNVFDGCYRGSIVFYAVQSSWATTATSKLNANIFTSSKAGQLDGKGPYGVENTISKQNVESSQNCYYGNKGGDTVGCSVSSSDLFVDPKTTSTPSGWTWVGSEWACPEVSPSEMGNIPGFTPLTNDEIANADKAAQEFEFNDIFDILEVEFTDTGRTEQTAEDVSYYVQETEQGRIAGGIKIIGFKDLINIDGVSYISNNDSVLVKYEAVKAPSYSWNSTGVSKIDKNVSVNIENGNATATLTVKMKWFKISSDSTGTTKKKYKTSEAVFSDTVKAPEVLQRPSELRGVLYEYPTYSIAYVPCTGLTQVEYEYDGKTVKHIYLIGEQRTNDNGIIYTNFSKVNYWKGDLPHTGEFLFINGSFDPEKLTVTAYTPYESFQITHFDYVKKDYPAKFYADWLFPSFGLFLILGFGAWYYIRKILY